VQDIVLAVFRKRFRTPEYASKIHPAPSGSIRRRRPPAAVELYFDRTQNALKSQLALDNQHSRVRFSARLVLAFVQETASADQSNRRED
jgi:hypothetical protein